MSVYIKGMEMPTSCCYCELCYDTFYCNALGIPFYDREDLDPGESRLPDCPLVPVPPHGRLGDLDKLEASFLKSLDKQNDDWMKTPTGMAERAMRVADWRKIKAAPTIIPADKEEERCT